MIKKLLILIILLTVSNSCRAETTDAKLLQAIDIISSYGYSKEVKILKSSNVKVKFTPLYELDYSYKNHYAITCSSDSDNYTYILIDSRLKKCDVKMLACLLLHESVHASSKLIKADLQEEYTAHTLERELYLKIANNTTLNIDEIMNRENNLVLVDIKDMLQKSNNYKDLFNKVLTK